MSIQTKLEGILLNKIPYRDRELICHILLRNGEKVSVLFFGGRGGGKSAKPSLLELGYLLKLELKKNQKKEEGMYIAEEWQVLWNHEKIRYEFKAFSLMTFYLEMINKVALTANLDINHDVDEQEGLFRVLSNALFYLEKSLSEKDFLPLPHLGIFLSKLTFELGVAPDPFHCTFCGEELKSTNLNSFEMQEGGFCCTACMQRDVKSNMVEMAQDRDLGFWSTLKIIWHLKYQEYKNYELQDSSVTDRLFQYLCFQFQIDPKSLKSFALIQS